MEDGIREGNRRDEAEKQRLNSVLVQNISRWTAGTNQMDTAIPSLRFSRWEHPTDPTSYTLGASVGLIVQGSKRVMLGEDAYIYGVNRYLVTSVDLPVVAQILDASPEKPYLGVIIAIDQQTLAQLMVDGNLPANAPRRSDRGIGVSRLSLPLLKVVSHLVELLDSPEDIPILAPLIRKELFYRLLVGPQGPRLRQIVMTGTHGYQIAEAIEWLKANYKEQYPMDDLAARANMSRSSFYNHFRSITSLSPLQYRKHLRLQEARRLMVVEQHDATTAAIEVGYDSPSQFTREYRRLFGASPARDAAGLRQAVNIADEIEVLTG